MHAGSLGERIYVGRPMAVGVDNVLQSVADKVMEMEGTNWQGEPRPKASGKPVGATFAVWICIALHCKICDSSPQQLRTYE